MIKSQLGWNIQSANTFICKGKVQLWLLVPVCLVINKGDGQRSERRNFVSIWFCADS